MPGAVRSWGDAHERFGRLSRADLLAPAIELAARRLPGLGRVHRASSGVRRSSRERRPDAAFLRDLPAVRPAVAPRRAGPAAGARDDPRAARHGRLDAFYEGELGERQARALAAAGSPITATDLREHASTWAEPIGIDYRGVRVTTHPPNSSGFVALELLTILEQFEPPPTGPRSGRTGCRPAPGSTSGSRRPSWRWPTATRT